MHYAPPALLASALAAALAPAQAEAPTSGSAAWNLQMGRVAVGSVVETFEAAAEEAYLVAQALPEPGMEVVSDAAPLPAETHRAPHGAPAQAAVSRAPVLVAQAAPSRPAPARPAASRPPAGRQAQPEIGPVNAGPVRPCSSVTVDPPTSLTLGKSEIIRLPFPVARVIVGGQPGSRAGRPVPTGDPGIPGAAAPQRTPAPQSGEGPDGVAETDVTLLSPTELFFLGRRTGSMNVVLQANDGRCIVKDIVVSMDPGTLQAKLAELMPEESNIKVRSADNALVLTGAVTDAVKLDHIVSLAGSYVDSKKVVNLLRVTAPQQVMLEVKIAEVSKTLLDRFGLDFSRLVTSANGVRSTIVSGIIGGTPGVVGRFGPNTAGGTISGAAVGVASSDIAAATGSVSTAGRGASILGLDMQKQDGVIRVLAEPNIMAISGQSASFLSGGKIFIPVAQTNNGSGGTTITLEEKEFGVGLKFTPTVLDGRINLKVTSEVSDLSQTGTPFTTVGGVTAVLPSLSVRRVDTTVQLADGQSFAVAGLIKNNMTEALNKFPGLGEVPVVGALFRSSEFQNDRSELMFVVTPKLVKPVVGPITLPTDNHVPPNASEVIFMGTGEGSGPPPQPVPAPAPSGQPGLPAPTAPASTRP
jgi:pilus assembly protein CpaC